MNNEQRLRSLLEDSASSYKFNYEFPYLEECISNSYNQMMKQYAKTEEEKITIDRMYQIIATVAKTGKVYLEEYSSRQLWEVVRLIYEESKDGCYTCDFGILWCGNKQYEEIIELKNKMMSTTDRLKKDLLSGNILQSLKIEFPNIQIQPEDEYMGYILRSWSWYSSNTFAVLGIYKLEIINTSVLDTESITNNKNRYLSLNKNIGFRLVNMKTGNTLKTETYVDIKRILSKA